MALDDSIRKRVDELLGEVSSLGRMANVYEQIVKPEDIGRCVAWMSSAQNIVHQICSGASTPYLAQADRIATASVGYKIHEKVVQLGAVLSNLKSDAEAGLISSVADRARAETFDNFLDHGAEYLKGNMKNEAGTIVGVVFEDTVRRICRKEGIVDKDQKLDSLISALAAKGKLTGVQAKRARAAGDVRTKATHAQWDEFGLKDVEAAITFTRELISSHLDA